MDVNSLFSRAEQEFQAGRLEDASNTLAQVRRAAGDHPAILHLLALVHKGRGLLDEARGAFTSALALAPADPAINNNYANLLDMMGDPDAALQYFDRALSAAPHYSEARYNRALTLQRVGRLDEALAELEALSAASPNSAKIHSARGGVLRQLGRLGEAAKAYEAALQSEPRRLVALHGRARIAMERGEESAAEMYRRALDPRPGDRELSLGLAEALEAEGDPAEGLAVLAGAVSEHPRWVEGHSALARMRWEAGEGAAFSREFEKALQAAPEDQDLWMAYTSALAAADLFAQAADAAARGRAAAGDVPALQLVEALNASEAGQLERAERLFNALPEDIPGKPLHEARHAMRRAETERALYLCEQALAEDPWSVGAWALRGLLWRLTNDDRAAWLHEQPGLVTTQQLDLDEAEIEAVTDHLRSLHRTRAHPIGQSLRGGTQTRGALFHREHPLIAGLAASIARAVQRHWEGLPPADQRHPLLRHREAQPRISGSWSVRLTGGGFHVSHIHPEGVLSSACYLVFPDGQGTEEGWLELGSAPENLGLDLDPLLKVEPERGKIALFPSTLFHGTRAFSSGERLTVAFDVVAA
ncbi:MAG TPA: tetratricopeptide repeat protein [Allosphingosinicella sp.]|nr:tetratricopeptide repeat protein [Allosphingosinicella sp.]